MGLCCLELPFNPQGASDDSHPTGTLCISYLSLFPSAIFYPIFNVPFCIGEKKRANALLTVILPSVSKKKLQYLFDQKEAKKLQLRIYINQF